MMQIFRIANKINKLNASHSIKTEGKNKLQTQHPQNNVYFMNAKPCETVALLVHVNIPHQGVLFNTIGKTQCYLQDIPTGYNE